MDPASPAALMVLALLAAGAPPPKMSKDPAVQRVATCFGNGETSSGMNKICYYDCLGSPAAITIPITSLCPLTIQR